MKRPDVADMHKTGTLPHDPFDATEPLESPPASKPRRSSVTLVRLSDVVPRPIEWVWPGWLPAGKLAVVDGDPGLGKSTMTLDIAARVSRGAAMPGDSRGALYGVPAGVVLLTAEDDPADTLRPRLDAAGADVTRIVTLAGVRTEDDRERMPRLADVDAIREAIDAVDARLVIVDPIMAYLGGDTHRDSDVRQSLGPVAHLAADRGVAVLVVRHLNKGGGSHAVYRGGGSIGIIGAARIGMLVARDPDDDGARVLAATKSNLAELPGSLGYRIVPSGTATRVEWTGSTTHTADGLLVAAAREDDAEPTAVDEAAEWLRGELAHGPREVAGLRRSARDAGMSWRTIERAKGSIGAAARRRLEPGRGAVGSWVWEMPDAEGSDGP